MSLVSSYSLLPFSFLFARLCQWLSVNFLLLHVHVSDCVASDEAILA